MVCYRSVNTALCFSTRHCSRCSLFRRISNSLFSLPLQSMSSHRRRLLRNILRSWARKTMAGSFYLWRNYTHEAATAFRNKMTSVKLLTSVLQGWSHRSLSSAFVSWSLQSRMEEMRAEAMRKLREEALRTLEARVVSVLRRGKAGALSLWKKFVAEQKAESSRSLLFAYEEVGKLWITDGRPNTRLFFSFSSLLRLECPALHLPVLPLL